MPRPTQRHQWWDPGITTTRPAIGVATDAGALGIGAATGMGGETLIRLL